MTTSRVPLVSTEGYAVCNLGRNVGQPCRYRNDGRGAPPREPAAAPKNEDEGAYTRALIRWSVQEIRRVAMRLAQRRIRPAHVIAWSVWRRAHQAAARKAHIERGSQL